MPKQDHEFENLTEDEKHHLMDLNVLKKTIGYNDWHRTMWASSFKIIRRLDDELSEAKQQEEGMKKRYRRRRSVKVWVYSEWNFKVEPGDLLVTFDGKLFRAESSNGYGKRNLGELTPRLIKPPQDGMIAIIEEQEIYWVRAMKEDSNA